MYVFMRVDVTVSTYDHAHRGYRATVVKPFHVTFSS